MNANEFPPKYHTYAEVNYEIDSLARAHPDIMHVDTLGYSTQYHMPIMYVKVSENPQIEEDQPAVLLFAAMHSDEILGIEVLMKFLNLYATSYAARDSLFRRWAENIELYVVPILNVEGHKRVEDGFTWWRKTCRDNNLNGVFDSLDGVDINRNFSLGWEAGPADTADFFYRGPWPFSESESQAVRALAYRKKFVIAIDYHSPTYGRGEVIYYPWNRSEMGGLAVDQPVLLDIARGMATKVLKDDSVHYYDYVNGGTEDGYHRSWEYNRFGTIAFTCEISDTTIQDTSMVDMICEHHMPGIKYLLDRALGSGVSGRVTDAATGEPIWAQVRILQAYHHNMAKRYTIPETGRYRRLLLPGTYTIEFEADGYRGKRFYNFNVADGATTEFDAELQPDITFTGVEEIYLPDKFELKQNYPNPFNSSTTIEYTVGSSSYNSTPRNSYNVSLEIYNLMGMKVAALASGPQSPGVYSVTWNGQDDYGNRVATGVYFYRLIVDNKVSTKKMLLLK